MQIMQDIRKQQNFRQYQAEKYLPDNFQLSLLMRFFIDDTVGVSSEADGEGVIRASMLQMNYSLFYDKVERLVEDPAEMLLR